MFFLPYDYFEIYTNLTPEEVQSRLSKVVEPWQLLPFAIDKYFMGEVVGKKFKMTRRIGYRNLFLPVILGEIYPDKKGSLIRVSMRLHLLVFFMFIIIFVFFSTVFVGFLSNRIISTKQLNFEWMPAELSSIEAFVCFYLLFLVPYKIETRIAKKMLFIMFEAESKENVIFYNRFAGLSQIQLFILLFTIIFIAIFVVALIKLLVA